MYDIIQWIIVLGAIAACVIYVLVRLFRKRKGPSCNCGCSSCPVAKHCDSAKLNTGKWSKKQ